MNITNNFFSWYNLSDFLLYFDPSLLEYSPGTYFWISQQIKFRETQTHAVPMLDALIGTMVLTVSVNAVMFNKMAIVVSKDLSLRYQIILPKRIYQVYQGQMTFTWIHQLNLKKWNRSYTGLFRLHQTRLLAI